MFMGLPAAGFIGPQAMCRVVGQEVARTLWTDI